ncbi:helix-turn-helix domain-containing protein [Dactylosporangium sp. NPDC000521]|uniref:helix-turn-helix transcriptional regulator n=1 Tax=Dactylosporangium sp. NPDC000521 TaxID=3363975 RepID=UPI0036CBEF99
MPAHLPDLPFGQRLKAARQRAGKTRAVVGGLVGRSDEWVKKIENGSLLPPRLPMLNRLAAAVGVPVGAFLDHDAPPAEVLAGPGHSGLDAVRDAMNRWPAVGAEPPTIENLRAQLAVAWRARHASPDHRTVLAGLLPSLIQDAQLAARAYDGDLRRQALALLCEVHVLAQMFLAYQLPAAGLLWRSAERAMLAAQEAESPYAIAGATWAHAQAHRDSGEWDAAMAVNLDGLAFVERHLDNADDELLSLYGALQFEAAFTAARTGDAGVAWRRWDEAQRVADRLPPKHYQPWTSFSRVIMGAHGVTIAVELRQPGEALRHARRTEAADIPSRPRRARHLIEVARAHHLRRDKRTAVATLDQSFAAAPETARFNAYARSIVLDSMTDRSASPAARDLGLRIGLPA